MTISHTLNRVVAYSHSKVKNCDLFPQNILLTYKGNDKFTTFFGGVVSILIMALLFVYGVSLFIIMINRADSSKSKSTEYRNLREYDHDIYPYEKGFRFTVSLTNVISQPIPLNPSLFTLEIYQGTYYNDGTSVQFTETSLGYEVCDLEKELPGVDYDISRATLSNMYCPINTDFKISGNYAGKQLLFGHE